MEYKYIYIYTNKSNLMRGHRPHSAFMQLLGFLSLAARYAAIPADFRKNIYIYIYIYLFI